MGEDLPHVVAYGAEDGILGITEHALQPVPPQCNALEINEDKRPNRTSLPELGGEAPNCLPLYFPIHYGKHRQFYRYRIKQGVVSCKNYQYGDLDDSHLSTPIG